MVGSDGRCAVGVVFAGTADGRPMSVSDAVRGASCACFCLVCGSPVVARKGDVVAWHFAHLGAAGDCGGGPETALHAAAKALLRSGGPFRLPSVGDVFGRVAETLWEGEELPASPSSGVPVVIDVALRSIDDDELFFVELAVTHFCDEAKVTSLIELGRPCVEVDLSALSGLVDVVSLDRAVRFSAPRRWLSSQGRSSLSPSSEATLRAYEAAFRLRLAGGFAPRPEDGTPEGRRRSFVTRADPGLADYLADDPPEGFLFRGAPYAWQAELRRVFGTEARAEGRVGRVASVESAVCVLGERGFVAGFAWLANDPHAAAAAVRRGLPLADPRVPVKSALLRLESSGFLLPLVSSDEWLVVDDDWRSAFALFRSLVGCEADEPSLLSFCARRFPKEDLSGLGETPGEALASFSSDELVRQASAMRLAGLRRERGGDD